MAANQFVLADSLAWAESKGYQPPKAALPHRTRLAQGQWNWFDFTPAAWFDLSSRGWEELAAESEDVPCWQVPGYTRPIIVGRSGGCRSFLERHFLLAADRLPAPRLALEASKINQIPLQPPLPLPPLQAHLNGMPPPDRGRTDEWPYPVETAQS
jgi:hypothetical protein